MADYQKMYTILCGVIDDAIAPLGKIPEARPFVRILQSALLEAEQLYIDTTPYLEPAKDMNVIGLKLDCPNKP